MNEEKQKSYVPALLTAAGAVWLMVNKRGELLTDIAHEAVGKVLYGTGKRDNKQPSLGGGAKNKANNGARKKSAGA